VVPGNTILINRNAAISLSSFYQPSITHYDSWFYLIMSAIGNVVYLDRELVRYRIHDNNFVGVRTRKNFSPLKSMSNYFENAMHFQNNNTICLKKSDTEYLIQFLNLISKENKTIRIRNLFSIKLYRQKRIDAIGMKFILLLGILFGKI
jgi:hypothetical protein